MPTSRSTFTADHFKQNQRVIKRKLKIVSSSLFRHISSVIRRKRNEIWHYNHNMHSKTINLHNTLSQTVGNCSSLCIFVLFRNRKFRGFWIGWYRWSNNNNKRNKKLKQIERKIKPSILSILTTILNLL